MNLPGTMTHRSKNAYMAVTTSYTTRNRKILANHCSAYHLKIRDETDMVRAFTASGLWKVLLESVINGQKHCKFCYSIRALEI